MAIVCNDVIVLSSLDQYPVSPLLELNSMPPPYSKGGYTRVPQSDQYNAMPHSYPPSSYAPAPPVMQQQSNNTVSIIHCTCMCTVVP